MYIQLKRNQLRYNYMTPFPSSSQLPMIERKYCIKFTFQHKYRKRKGKAQEPWSRVASNETLIHFILSLIIQYFTLLLPKIELYRSKIHGHPHLQFSPISFMNERRKQLGTKKRGESKEIPSSDFPHSSVIFPRLTSELYVCMYVCTY